MITFYYGAGSPYAWRVWLALEHKALPYEMKLMSFAQGDLKKPEFVALNPRRRVPAIVDDDFVLYESAAILEYFEEAYPGLGQPLFPPEPRSRALVRRMVCEADDYFRPALDRLVWHVLFTNEADWRLEKIQAARDDIVTELGLWAAQMRGGYLAGALSAADFTLYPMLALALRCEKKKQDLGLRAALPPDISAWMRCVESLPFFSKTRPPHWK